MPSSWRKGFLNKAKAKDAKSSSEYGEPTTGAAVEQSPRGLKIVAEGKDSVVDIVAVHGLNGHRDKTWTAANGVHWLRDLLPNDIPNARVFCWGYNANTHGKRVSSQYLYDHAIALVSELCLRRELTETTKRPIVFIGHSLGGIIIKSALIHSDAAREGALKEHRSIKMSTYGIIFMGTPHRGGSGVQFGELLVNVASVFMATDDRLIKNLEEDSEWLQQQLGQYTMISRDFVTKFAFEELETPTVLGHSIMVVPKTSAVVPGATDAETIAMDANHTDMVRFHSREDHGYDIVSGHLQIMVRRANGVIASRWEGEDNIVKARANGEDSFSVSFSLSEVSATEHFVARQEELENMHEILCRNESNDGQKTVVLHGLGGMGKTQLAVAYAKQHKDEYSAVLWLNIKDHDAVKRSYVRIASWIRQQCSAASQLSSITETSSLDDVVAAVKRWLDHPKNTRWLMIFDNYDNPKLANTTEPTAVDIRQFIPDAYHGSIIVTTRSSEVAIGHRIPVCKLKDVRDSLQILCHTSRRPNAINDPGAAEVAKELDGLPLALATAGVYLDQVATSFQEYLRLYKVSWLRLQQTTPELVSYEDKRLYTTWQLSYDHIKQRNELSARLLHLWAYFDNQDLWFELLQEGKQLGPEWFSQLATDELSFNDAMRVLCNHGLAEANTPSILDGVGSTGYSMHNCVHEWIMHVLNHEWSNEMARLSLHCVSLHVPEVHTKGYWITQRRLVQHASRCWLFAKTGRFEEDANLPGALRILGKLYLISGKLEESEQILDLALQNLESTSGHNHPKILIVLVDMGYVYMRQGKLMKAKETLERTVQCCERTLGTNHICTLFAYSIAAMLYRDLDQLEKAEGMYIRALQGCEKALKSGHWIVIEMAHLLGNLYHTQTKLDKAEALYLLALASFEETVGPDHQLTIFVIKDLGLLYAELGRFDDAFKMYEQAVQGAGKDSGRDPLLVWATCYDLSMIFTGFHRPDEAVSVIRTVLENKEEMLGPDHILTLDTVRDMGNLYKNLGRLVEAEEMLLRALGREQALGRDHPSTLDVVQDMGELYVRSGKLAEAEEMLLRALRGREKVLGPEHKSTLGTVSDLAALYKRMGREEEAQQLYMRFPKSTAA